jgi:hypothetical protein
MFERSSGKTTLQFVGETLSNRKRCEALEELVRSKQEGPGIFRSESLNAFSEPWIVARYHDRSIDILICWSQRSARDPLQYRTYYSVPLPFSTEGSLPILSDGKRVVRFSRVGPVSGAPAGFAIELGTFALGMPGVSGISDPFERLLFRSDANRLSFERQRLTGGSADLSNISLPKRTGDGGSPIHSE